MSTRKRRQATAARSRLTRTASGAVAPQLRRLPEPCSISPTTRRRRTRPRRASGPNSFLLTACTTTDSVALTSHGNRGTAAGFIDAGRQPRVLVRSGDDSRAAHGRRHLKSVVRWVKHDHPAERLSTASPWAPHFANPCTRTRLLLRARRVSISANAAAEAAADIDNGRQPDARREGYSGGPVRPG